MSNAAYTIGQLVKLVEEAAPSGHLNVFANVVTASTLAETVGIIGLQWLDKCRKQMTSRAERNAFDNVVGELLDTLSAYDLEDHWTDDTRGQYTLGYMQYRIAYADELTASEAATMAGISRQSLIARLKSGSLQGRKDRHGHWLVSREALEAWAPGKTGPKKGD